MDPDRVEITLTKAEAIVLFDWIARFNRTTRAAAFEHQAEQRVLRDVECMLERVLVEPLQPDYDRILAKARASVRDPA